jgi:hypothetical protein
MDKETFEEHRENWKSEWFSNWRLLDIDFEMYMLMNGLTKEKFDELNIEEYNNINDLFL